MKYIMDRLILVAVLVALFYGALWMGKSYFAFKQAELNKKEQYTESMQRQYSQLQHQIAQLQSSRITQHQINKLVKSELSKEVESLIKHRKEKPTTVVVTTSATKNDVTLDPKIWKHYLNPSKPESEYYFMKLYKTADNGVKIPWAWVMYFPSKKQHWKYGFYKLKLQTTTVLTKQKHGGENAYTKLTVENTNDKASKGKQQRFVINKDESFVKWVQPKSKEWLFWQPSVDFGADILYNINENEVINGVGLGFTFMGYGNEYQLDWKFFTLGLGTDFNTYWAFLRPVSVNMQRLHIPLIHHLYFAPEVGYSDRNDWLVGGALNLEF